MSQTKSETHDCIFCKIVLGQIPAQRVYEDENVLAFKDVSPMAPIHILFIPKKHYRSLADIPAHDMPVMTQIFVAIQKVTEDLKINQSGYRTAINTGKQGGQSVFHLHAHVLSGKNLSAKFD